MKHNLAYKPKPMAHDMPVDKNDDYKYTHYPMLKIGENYGEMPDFNIPELEKIGVGGKGKAVIEFNVKEIEMCDENIPDQKHYELNVESFKVISEGKKDKSQERINETVKTLKGGYSK